MVLALLLACAPADPTEAIVLSGWHYEWETLSHRVSRLRAVVEPDASLSLGLVGGDYSTGETFVDVPHYRMRFQRVRTPYADFLQAEGSFEVGPEPEASLTLTLDAAGLDERRGLVALLQGWDLDTDIPQAADYPADYDPGYGYTSAGFGVRLGEPTRVGDEVQVPVTARVRWAPQDRDDMNAAIPHARTALTLRVLLVAYDGTLDATTVRGGADYPYTPPYTDQPPMGGSFAFDGGRPEGFLGWTGFDLLGEAVGDDEDGQGDYLRAFGAEAVPSADDARRLEGAVTATLSTSSFIEFTQLSASFEADLVRIGLKEAEVEHWVVEGAHPTGLATVPTMLDE